MNNVNSHQDRALLGVGLMLLACLPLMPQQNGSACSARLFGFANWSEAGARIDL